MEEFSPELTYQSLNGVLPSRKCSIKAPAKIVKPLFMSCQRSFFNEVNNWAPSKLGEKMMEEIKILPVHLSQNHQTAYD